MLISTVIETMNISPNNGKKIEIEVEGKTWHRYPIKTEVFAKGDDYADKISNHVLHVISNNQFPIPSNEHWYVIVSEKIVAISQGRSYFIKDIKPSWWASTLSKYVKRTPHGIGLGSPWTMELAIREVGLPRILIAALASVITKPFGLSGVFYHVAGPSASAIDGPTEYSLYPSNVSAKLAPKDPEKAAETIRKAIELRVTSDELSEQKLSKAYSVPPKLKAKGDHLQPTAFSGVVIIDANDLGRKVLGNATDKPNSFFEDLMRDNPMGQGNEQTPVVIAI